MITTDYHMHTHFSHDSQVPLEEMCETALGHGLRDICLTEHFDFDLSEPDCSRLNWDGYAAAVEAARARFAGRLTIRIGVEFGFRRAYGPKLGELIARMPLDFAIGSVHAAGGYQLYHLRKGVPADFDTQTVLEDYLEEVEALVASGWCHCLGHFDYVYKQVAHLVEPLRNEWYWRTIEGILRRCIGGGVAIEVNTHHIGEGLAMAADPELLRRYHALGGRLVTVGSDSHRTSEVAHDFPMAEEALLAAGFDQVCGYQGGRPYFVPIGR
jgi:histidinol-phosphatase (PHP family)